MTAIDTSPYLSGNYGPVTDEVTAFDLPVIGELPTELDGRYLRNGPNPIGPVDPTTHHWFMGDGMVHGIRLRGGKDRKSTRLNSSHSQISYAVFCLKKKKNKKHRNNIQQTSL